MANDGFYTISGTICFPLHNNKITYFYNANKNLPHDKPIILRTNQNGLKVGGRFKILGNTMV